MTLSSSQSAREVRVYPITYARAPLGRIDDHRARGNLGLQFAARDTRNVESSWLMGSSSSPQANNILGATHRDGKHTVVRRHAQTRDAPQIMGAQPSSHGNSKRYKNQVPTTHAIAPQFTPPVIEVGNLH